MTNTVKWSLVAGPMTATRYCCNVYMFIVAHTTHIHKYAATVPCYNTIPRCIRNFPPTGSPCNLILTTIEIPTAIFKPLKRYTQTTRVSGSNTWNIHIIHLMERLPTGDIFLAFRLACIFIPIENERLRSAWTRNEILDAKSLHLKSSFISTSIQLVMR